jgi:hypothetical protein
MLSLTLRSTARHQMPLFAAWPACGRAPVRAPVEAARELAQPTHQGGAGYLDTCGSRPEPKPSHSISKPNAGGTRAFVAGNLDREAPIP